MKRKRTLLIVSSCCCAALASILTLGRIDSLSASTLRGNSISYGISFSLEKNKLHSYVDNEAHEGETTLKTNLGGDVKFAFSGVKGSNSSWHVLGSDGCFYNADPIHGLSSITLSFNSDGLSYEVLYSRDASFSRSKKLTSSQSKSNTFDFDEYRPNYFKVLNTGGSDLDISSVEVSFSCLDDYWNLSVVSEDGSRGTVTGGGVMRRGEEVTIEAKPNDGYVFSGWYEDNSLLSKDNPYTFEMPSNERSLKARFMTKTEAEGLGILPVIDETNSTLTYGLYPQTHVNDETTLGSLNKLTSEDADPISGWYLLDGTYYAKKTATPWSDNYKFDDGNYIIKGTDYWFKCEPIAWKILSSSSGVYSLVSSLLLDVQPYANSSNKYIDSSIRLWLNKSFYNSAFSLDKSLIQTVTVDNSLSTTGDSVNPYACENTKDNVYLLSYSEYTNSSWFADNPARMCKATELVRASGAFFSTGSVCSDYWTRSPDSSSSTRARDVNEKGGIATHDVSSADRAVRPGICIKIAQ